MYNIWRSFEVWRSFNARCVATHLGVTRCVVESQEGAAGGDEDVEETGGGRGGGRG